MFKSDLFQLVVSIISLLDVAMVAFTEAAVEKFRQTATAGRTHFCARPPTQMGDGEFDDQHFVAYVLGE